MTKQVYKNVEIYLIRNDIAQSDFEAKAVLR